MQIFGFNITRSKPENEENLTYSTIPLPDGTSTISDAFADGAYSAAYSQIGINRLKTVKDLVTKYRDLSAQPEIDFAVDEISNEAIVYDDDNQVVNIDLKDTKLPDGAVSKIAEEFDNVLSLLKFRDDGWQTFRTWYVEGRLYCNIVIDGKNPRAGINKLNMIDSTTIEKVKKVMTKRDPISGIMRQVGTEEYYEYMQVDQKTGNGQKIRLAKDAVIFVPSGLVDRNENMVLSYLHSSIRPMNMLRTTEDAMLIYRLVRAPERRAFYIDVGTLPKIKAEQYLTGLMQKFRNNVVYDTKTGMVSDGKRQMSMLEDFWLPRREGSRGTEISPLQGSSSMNQTNDLDHYYDQLIRSTHVPATRFKDDGALLSGRATDITKDELRFARFVTRLRQKFSHLFLELLKTQCVLKGICTDEEWTEFAEKIRFRFTGDSYFEEARAHDLMTERINLVDRLQPYIGHYFSNAYIRDKVLRQTEDQIKIINSENDEDPSLQQPDDNQENVPGSTVTVDGDPYDSIQAAIDATGHSRRYIEKHGTFK